MIIVTDTTGLWGNQLWAYSSIIAIAKECNTRVIINIKRNFYEVLDQKIISHDKNLIIYPTDCFAAKRIKWLTGFLRYRSAKKGFLKKILNKFPFQFIDEFVNEYSFKKDLKKNHLYFINSWEQRDNKTFFLAHSTVIRELIQPIPTIIMNVSQKIKTLRVGCDIIVGVHIRRADDYKTWHGGRFYFDDAVFERSMFCITQLLPSKKILFYIFSDKSVNTTDYPGFNLYFADKQNPMYDLWAMGQCDYLMGPLSTFSMWGSFWNKVPLHYIDKSKQGFSLADFDIIAAQDLFQNGYIPNS